jgi:D-sedoheptulose 7-phosphate isomerase
MNSNEIIERSISEHLTAIKLVQGTLLESIDRIGVALSRTLASGGSVYWCGNGGSAADSQHLAAELVGRFNKDRRPLRSVALTTDTSVLTCVANDFSYDDIFSRQIEALGRKGDALIGISTSGESVNVLNALKVAKSLDINTIALLGKTGGACQGVADLSLVIPVHDTARIQEAHILVGHILCELIEKELGLV